MALINDTLLVFQRMWLPLPGSISLIIKYKFETKEKGQSCCSFIKISLTQLLSGPRCSSKKLGVIARTYFRYNI